MAASILPFSTITKPLSSTHTISPHFLTTTFSNLTISHPPFSTPIRMGGGPRTFPGGVSKWQWKRMQLKKSKQLLKARLARERQIYEMRKRAELKAAVSELERPWEVVEKSPKLFSASADEQVKVLADRFQKPGGFDLWSDKDGPVLFETVDGFPSARFFPKGVVHSVRPYGIVANLEENEGLMMLGSGEESRIGNGNQNEDVGDGKRKFRKIRGRRNVIRDESGSDGVGLDLDADLGDWEELKVFGSGNGADKLVRGRGSRDRGGRRISFSNSSGVIADQGDGPSHQEKGLRTLGNGDASKRLSRRSGDGNYKSRRNSFRYSSASSGIVSDRGDESSWEEKTLRKLGNEDDCQEEFKGRGDRKGPFRRGSMRHSSGDLGVRNGVGGDKNGMRWRRGGNGNGLKSEVFDMNLQRDGSYGISNSEMDTRPRSR